MGEEIAQFKNKLEKYQDSNQLIKNLNRISEGLQNQIKNKS